MSISSQRGAVCYRQNPAALWEVQMQPGPGKRWVQHSVCATADEAAAKVLRLGRHGDWPPPKRARRKAAAK